MLAVFRSVVVVLLCCCRLFVVLSVARVGVAVLAVFRSVVVVVLLCCCRLFVVVFVACVGVVALLLFVVAVAVVVVVVGVVAVARLQGSAPMFVLPTRTLLSFSLLYLPESVKRCNYLAPTASI